MRVRLRAVIVRRRPATALNRDPACHFACAVGAAAATSEPFAVSLFGGGSLVEADVPLDYAQLWSELEGLAKEALAVPAPFALALPYLRRRVLELARLAVAAAAGLEQRETTSAHGGVGATLSAVLAAAPPLVICHHPSRAELRDELGAGAQQGCAPAAELVGDGAGLASGGAVGFTAHPDAFDSAAAAAHAAAMAAAAVTVSAKMLLAPGARQGMAGVRAWLWAGGRPGA